MAGPDTRRTPLVIAHRGASAFAPENSIESFKKAIEIGADMIEFDVRQTKDNFLIAYHDRFLGSKPVTELTYSEIEGAMASESFHVPTVEEVLELAKEKVALDIEIKEEGYENGLMELLLEHLDESAFVVTSSLDSTLRAVKEHYPGVRVGLIAGDRRPERLLRIKISDLFPITRCKKAKADFLVAHFRLLRFGLLGRAKRNNIPVYVWTVNAERMIWKFLSENRVEGIITDRPDIPLAMRNDLLAKQGTEKGDSRMVSNEGWKFSRYRG
jgi:glycerophosphoryl diester phosphodiesterase